MASYLYSGLTGGSWSTAANWTNMSTNTTGTVPTSADDAYLHNKTVIIDASINVNKISNRATTGFSVNAAAGGSATVTLTTSYCPTITIGSGGIEASQATTAGNTISVSGTTLSSNVFQILCSGNIIGGYNNSQYTINIACTNTNILIASNNITGGITSGSCRVIGVLASGNTVYINNTDTISGGSGAAIFWNSTGSLYLKSTSIIGGTLAAIEYPNNLAFTQYIGYSYDFSTSTSTVSKITNITASSTFPAIQSYTSTSPYNNTTPFLINATNINHSTNGFPAIYCYNYKLNSDATVKIPNLSAMLQSFVVGATPPIAASDVWNFLTANATTAGSLGKLIVDNLNAKVGDVKTATDRIPTNPASVQSTGDQIATIN
jgi:hypothetical protein